VSEYKVTVVGPGDEVLDIIDLDGLDLSRPGDSQYIGEKVADGMGSTARAHCAALTRPEET
jgi:hypothetical protein